MANDQRKSLQDKIAETLKLFANEYTATTSQAFDIIRWARQGYLEGKSEMTEAQQRLIDSHMLESMSQSIRLNTAFSFNAVDMVECLERAAKIVRPKLEEVK